MVKYVLCMSICIYKGKKIPSDVTHFTVFGAFGRFCLDVIVPSINRIGLSVNNTGDASVRVYELNTRGSKCKCYMSVFQFNYLENIYDIDH